MEFCARPRKKKKKNHLWELRATGNQRHAPPSPCKTRRPWVLGATHISDVAPAIKLHKTSCRGREQDAVHDELQVE